MSKITQIYEQIRSLFEQGKSLLKKLSKFETLLKILSKFAHKFYRYLLLL
jgi:hypothetical protein